MEIRDYGNRDTAGVESYFIVGIDFWDGSLGMPGRDLTIDGIVHSWSLLLFLVISLPLLHFHSTCTLLSTFTWAHGFDGPRTRHDYAL